jgi:hypothetical protein
VEFYERSLAIAREIGDRQVEGMQLFNMSLAHLKSGDLPAAIQATEASLQSLEAIESPLAERARTLLDYLREQLGETNSPVAPETEPPL